MNSSTAYALSRAFTSQTADAFGAVKGAPCTVAGTSFDADGNTVVKYQWKNEAGTIKTTDVTIKKGKDGESIESVEIDEDNHLIIKMTDGTELDAGSLGAGSSLSEDLTATVDIGSVKSGKKYLKGTPFETILRDILIKVESPVVLLNFNPSTTVYDIVTASVSTLGLVATVEKKTYPIKSIKYYVGNSLVETKTEGVANGGNFTCTYNPDTPIKSTTSFKVVAEDTEGNTKTYTNTISFVGQTYYGFVDPSVITPSETGIKALGKILKTVKGYVYKNIVCSYNKVVYAYPVSFGELTSIKDVVNNLNYTTSFRKETVKVDNIDYYVYTQNDASAANGVELTFA